ncbi:MAG: hypothetical protein IT379_11560 [Deltaproteobacteria bacterium]|nr:hypothetical protein [Deltaproteobacteria bacterium]
MNAFQSAPANPLLQSFLAEIPGVGADDTPAASPAAVLARSRAPSGPDDKGSDRQHLRMAVPGPRTYLRMGATNDKKYGMDGFVTTTVASACVLAQGNVVSVAGHGKQKDAYEHAKAESSGQGIAQTVVAGTIDLMKMALAPGKLGLGLAGGAAAVAGGIVKVSLEKGKSGVMSLTAKDSFSAIGGVNAQLAGAVTTTVWGGVATKCGANVALSLQGGMVASLAAAKTAAVVSFHEAELVSGFETEVASRFGETIIHGREIKIGGESHGWTGSLVGLINARQRPCTEIEMEAEHEIKLGTGPIHGKPNSEAKLFMHGGEVKVDAHEMVVLAEERAQLHAGWSTLTVEPDAVQISVTGTFQASLEAQSAALEAYDEAVEQIKRARAAAMAASGSPMAAHATAFGARIAAQATYLSAMAAAKAAKLAALEAAKISSPTLEVASDEIQLSTSKTNGVEISKVKGIKLTSGAGEITMSPAGIVLKFGPSKIILGPAGIVLDAGPGLITQKASLVNSP